MASISTVKHGDIMNQSLGTKRQCTKCPTKFYDLNADPASCPKCGTKMKTASNVAARAKSHKVASPKKPKRVKVEEEMDTLAGMGGVVELEELDEFDDDLEHLEEVEDHQEEPEKDINSDDADDDMFIGAEDKGILIDNLEEDEDAEEEPVS